jgi:hypothetical protein
MPLDFPTSPSDGDLHTDGSTTWQWRASPGLWTVATSGVPTEIVEANTSTGWQVVGDVLFQWGLTGGTDANGLVTVTLPKAFGDTGYACGANVAGITTVTADRTANIGSQTTTTFQVFISANGSPSVGVGGYWWAYGPAPLSLRKPKSIQAAGGLYVQEYHDPLLAASWRVLGTTFEQWGRLLVPNGGYSSYGYAKPLASAPAATVSAYNGSGINAELTVLNSTNFGIVTRISSTGVTAVSWATYHVIGELA